MADIETNGPRMFARREFIAISVVSIVLVALALLYARSFEATSRFATEVQLGNAGTGAPFEPAGVTLARLQDDILEYVPEDLLQKHKISDLKSRVVYMPIKNGTVIRLRTVGVESDRAKIEDIHRYIANEIVKRILPLATAERSRLQSQIERVQDNLRAIDRQQAEYRSFEAESEKIQTRLGDVGNRLRNRTGEQAQQQSPPKETAETAANYVLMRDIEALQIISAPLQHARSRFEEAKLDRDKADLQADQRRWAQELSRWEPPSIARLAVTGKGPYLSSLPGYLVMGVMVGTLVAFALIWTFKLQRSLRRS